MNGENKTYDDVSNPAHYCGGRRYEPRKVIADWKLNFNLGNAVKYISRAGRKGDAVEDLRKAIQYIEFEIEDRAGGEDKADDGVRDDAAESVRRIRSVAEDDIDNALYKEISHRVLVEKYGDLPETELLRCLCRDPKDPKACTTLFSEVRAAMDGLVSSVGDFITFTQSVFGPYAGITEGMAIQRRMAVLRGSFDIARLTFICAQPGPKSKPRPETEEVIASTDDSWGSE